MMFIADLIEQIIMKLWNDRTLTGFQYHADVCKRIYLYIVIIIKVLYDFFFLSENFLCKLGTFG